MALAVEIVLRLGGWSRACFGAVSTALGLGARPANGCGAAPRRRGQVSSISGSKTSGTCWARGHRCDSRSDARATGAGTTWRPGPGASAAGPRPPRAGAGEAVRRRGGRRGGAVPRSTSDGPMAASIGLSRLTGGGPSWRMSRPSRTVSRMLPGGVGRGHHPIRSAVRGQVSYGSPRTPLRSGAEQTGPARNGAVRPGRGRGRSAGRGRARRRRAGRCARTRRSPTAAGRGWPRRSPPRSRARRTGR